MPINVNPQKILIIHLDSTSEVILSTPVARALKNAYPIAKIVMLAAPLSNIMAELNPYVDRVLVYDKRGEHRGISGTIEIVNMLRKEKFNIAICMNFSLRGALVAWAAGIPVRIGYDLQITKFFLTHAVDSVRQRVCHRSIEYLRLLAPLSIVTEDTSLAVTVDDRLKEMVEATLQLNTDKPIVIFCPLNLNHPGKSLSMGRALEVICHLAGRVTLCLIGGIAESSALNELAGQAGMASNRVFAGTLNIKETAILIGKAQAMLSVDAGTVYIAQALKVPVVALFGPTDPFVYGPRGNADTILSCKTECMQNCKKEQCTDWHCMEEIPLDDITEKLMEKVGRQ